jgi:hypothetical protein
MRISAKILAASTCLAGGLAFAGSTLAQPALLQPTSPDQAAILTLQAENSSISSQGLTDRYYTNGLHLGYQSPEDAYPALSRLSQGLWGDGRVRISVDLTQQIFTPANTQAANPPAGDRPYAGVLLGSVSTIEDGDNSRSALGLSLGVVGPSALGQTVQNGFHDLIGQGDNHGWHTQLHDEAVFAVNASRVWRVPAGSVFGLETDALPGISITLGTLKVNLEAGFNLRLGQGLQNDYGAPRINALGGGDAFKRGGVVGWYVFAGGGGQVVGHDVTLDGNTFENSRSVKLNPLVGKFDLGLAVLAFGTRISYTQVIQTQDFRHQKGGPHQFGSLAASVRF